MPQKSNNNQPVMRTILEEVLNKVLDEKLKNFATKDDLKTLETKIDENARKYRDQIMNKYSPIVSDISTLQEENDIGTHQYNELRETTENHEKRILALEQKPLAA